MIVLGEKEILGLGDGDLQREISLISGMIASEDTHLRVSFGGNCNNIVVHYGHSTERV